MGRDEIFSLTWAQLMGYLNALPQLISRDAAIAMPWDAMVDKKSRPKDVPEFFQTQKPLSEMTELERRLITGNLPMKDRMKLMMKEGMKKQKQNK
jgi:hypothetical protein